jgi:hypothetical protein
MSSTFGGPSLSLQISAIITSNEELKQEKRDASSLRIPEMLCTAEIELGGLAIVSATCDRPDANLYPLSPY